MSKLIPKVVAQSEPTFPYDGPFEDPTPTPTTSGEAAVKLVTQTSSLQIGNTATCDLRVESGTEEVQNYSIIISFNSSILEVVDANTVQTGTQVNFLDSFATVTSNTVDNTAGTITLNATVSGTAESINRRIAEITFRAKRTGTSIVSVNKASSSVTGDAGSDILGTTTSLNFTVSGQTETNGQLPSSGLMDNLATFGSATLGLLMLYVGIKTIIDRRKENQR
ncbi:hypothetical protein ACFLY9_02120 [Patescibacteria group bacterium]